jgi:hypothetical protein
MKFGFSKYVKINDYDYPLPNGYSDSHIKEKVKEYDYSTLSQFNAYKFLFKKSMKYCEHGFGAYSVDELIERNEIFIYPIFIKGLFDIKNLSNQDYFIIEDRIIQKIKENKCKIVLFYLLEGDFINKEHFDGVNSFVQKYGLTKKDVILVNNNIILNEIAKTYNYETNFTIITYNYFMTNLWFTKFDFLDFNIDLELKLDLGNKINYVCEYVKEKKFLILNRRPRPHRVVLFAEIMKDENLKSNSIISMGGTNIDDNLVNNDSWGPENLKNTINNWTSKYQKLIDADFKYDKKSGIDFLNAYDITKNYFVDANPSFNLAFNINETLQTNTFVNVITETLFDLNTVFLSEKIFKPIFTCQPFIVLGNPYTLRELRNLGFKTFDNFWDESYDEELNFSKRLEKILDVLHLLNEKSNEELLQLTRSMSDILRHNYENLISKSREEVFKLKRLLNEQFS